MPPGQPRHGPSPSQSQPKTGPGSILTAQVPPSVNRKKAKRRAKEAAKKAAEQAVAGSAEIPSPPASTSTRNGTGGYNMPGAFDQNGLDPHAYPPDDLGPDDRADDYGEANGEYYYSDAEASYVNQRPIPTHKSKKKKRKNHKTGSIAMDQDGYYASDDQYSNHQPPPPPPPPLPLTRSHSHRFDGERIWSQSGHEERENIKEFWLSLEETERRSLVKVEKEAVLKKMKEQQKHSCSCSVCGRKRTAIEEELEVLYDAYYEELEQYANHRVELEDGTVIEGPEAARVAAYPSVPGRLPPFVGRNGPQSRFQEESMGDEEELEDEYLSEEEEEEEEEGEEEYEDDEYDHGPPPHANDFFNFGNSLTVQGGILTVADDLLKNDGKKFIEMMEQLAERRMRREEDAQYAAPDRLRNIHEEQYPQEPYDDAEDDEEDYATEDDEYPEDDEPEDGRSLTEKQRMEEGRRMFQIFAARMFEQRVLTAYREKVARERQDRLLEELEDEKDRDAEKEAAKARKSAKNKEKKQRQKQQREEEKARKEAEKQAAVDAAKADEERKAEEQRRKKEEQRKKREDEKKRLEDEKVKKEEERKRKQAELRKQQEEVERKARESKEKDRLRREEARKKETEDRVSKEKAAKERREREAAEKKERDAKARAEKQAVQAAKKAEQAKAAAASPGAAIPAGVPPLLKKQPSSASVPTAPALHAAQPSPLLQVATPVIPKAPTPTRPRQASQHGSSVQGSHQSSPKSGQPPSGSSATSPSTTQQAPAMPAQPPATKVHMPGQPSPHHPVPGHAQGISPPPGMSFPQASAPGMPINGFQGGFPPHHAQPPRFPPHDPAGFGGPVFGGPSYRGFGGPNGMPYPPGMNGVRPMGSGPPGIPPMNASGPHPMAGPFGMHSHSFNPAPGQRTQPHSRQHSASVEKSSVEPPSGAPAQPIGPPAPIKRPSSSGEKAGNKSEEPKKQLGSSALLEDDPVLELPTHVAQGAQHPFPFLPDPYRSAPARPTLGSPAASPFHTGFSGPIPPGWGAPQNAPFGGGPFGAYRHHPRPIWLRLMLVEACTRLSKSPHTQNAAQGGYHSVEAIANEINAMRPQNEPHVAQQELLDICDTEGSPKNGGGTFVRSQSQAGPGAGMMWIKFEPDGSLPTSARHSVGDIGSPIPSHATPSFAVGAPGFAPGRPFSQAPGGSSF